MLFRSKFDVVQQLKDELRKRYETINVDGVRVLFPEGWGLFRCSNTGPTIVTRCEARSPHSLLNYVEILSQAFSKICPDIKIPWEIID